jgi:hypothetical protein
MMKPLPLPPAPPDIVAVRRTADNRPLLVASDGRRFELAARRCAYRRIEEVRLVERKPAVKT